MGMYASKRSAAINQKGAGIMKQAEIPPIRNIIPIMSAYLRVSLGFSQHMRMAPLRVPNAWARKGNRKCMGRAFLKPAGAGIH